MIGDKVTYFARYLDWLVTTPLLLVALAFTAMHYMPKDKVLIGGLIAADVFMILRGLIADLSPTPVYRSDLKIFNSSFLKLKSYYFYNYKVVLPTPSTPEASNPSLNHIVTL